VYSICQDEFVQFVNFLVEEEVDRQKADIKNEADDVIVLSIRDYCFATVSNFACNSV